MLSALFALLAATAAAAQTDTLAVPGLDAPVEILVDPWGIPHIYASSEHDLFFAQGYNAARDRLFQLEVWRRRATGTVAEILGPRELERDIGTRLFMFRGDMREEMRHYHPRGEAIITAFVDGVNAYIARTEQDPSLLPVEFELLGIRPGRWTPAVVVSRHQGLLGNINNELDYGRAVARAGAETVLEIADFHPGTPDIALDPAIDGALLEADILSVYHAFRRGIRFESEDLLRGARPGEPGRPQAGAGPGGGGSGFAAAGGLPGAVEPGGRREAGGNAAHPDYAADQHRSPITDHRSGLRQRADGVDTHSADPASPGRSAVGGPRSHSDIGSNNWVVSGALTRSGRPFMANDPHRSQAAPSLRYWVHLVGPGWNVIGGGEPEIPGVSIGHNEHGAWGLTVFATDGEDLYVYETSPSDPDAYRYRGEWAAMTVIVDTVAVKGADVVVVEHRYTRHGPVVYQDSANGVAYAVRAAWMEVGGSPYLASLRMDQARTWDEFRDACGYSHIPGENMVWADTSGTIGWQAVGIAPVRPNWSGLVPVPGDGRYEWAGYLPIPEKPHVADPPEGFWATANNDLIPDDYPRRDAVAWEWSDPFRWARIAEVLGSGRKLDMMDMMRLQTDVLSLPARSLVPLLEHVETDDALTETARLRLLDWDYRLEPGSVAAGIYFRWERRLRGMAYDRFVPDTLRGLVGFSTSTLVELMAAPDQRLGADPVAGRDAFLLTGLEAAVAELRTDLGDDPEAWRLGAFKHAYIRHPLSGAVSDELRARLDVGPAPRGGNGYTVNSTGSGFNQTSGASFRIIADVGAWDRSVGMSNPGQAGNPDSPLYRNLFEMWAADRFFPVLFSREAVRSVTVQELVLVP